MDTLELRDHVIAVLSDEAQHIPVGMTSDVVLVTDTIHDHYQVIYLGWDGPRREYHPLVHIRIIEGKAWIECDGTADGIATRLELRGVPPSQIVLAFHPPFKRHLTDYAIA